MKWSRALCASSAVSVIAASSVLFSGAAIADDGRTNTAPASYGVSVSYDSANDLVTGSARNVGGSWYLTLEQRATSSQDWVPLAGGPQTGTAEASATNCVYTSCDGGNDFRGDWRTCVILDRNTESEQRLCGGVINTVSGPFVNAAMANQAPPTIAGTPRVGVQLTATPGSWSPAGSYTYQWLANGSVLSGATSSTYTPTAGVKGKRISVRVSASKAGYTSASATSAQTAAVAAGIIKNTAIPKTTGTKKVGKTLTASVGSWSQSGLTYRYQWLRNGKVIKGATAKKYKLTKANKGKRISVRVTVSKAGYTTVSKTSTRTAKIR